MRASPNQGPGGHGCPITPRKHRTMAEHVAVGSVDRAEDAQTAGHDHFQLPFDSSGRPRVSGWLDRSISRVRSTSNATSPAMRHRNETADRARQHRSASCRPAEDRRVPCANRARCPARSWQAAGRCTRHRQRLVFRGHRRDIGEAAGVRSDWLSACSNRAARGSRHSASWSRPGETRTAKRERATKAKACSRMASVRRANGASRPAALRRRCDRALRCSGRFGNPLVRRRIAFISDVVRGAREVIDRDDRGTEPSGREPRCDGKVFVVIDRHESVRWMKARRGRWRARYVAGTTRFRYTDPFREVGCESGGNW